MPQEPSIKPPRLVRLSILAVCLFLLGLVIVYVLQQGRAKAAPQAGTQANMHASLDTFNAFDTQKPHAKEWDTKELGIKKLSAKQRDIKEWNAKELVISLQLRRQFDDIILTLQTIAANKNSATELLNQLASNLSLSEYGQRQLHDLFSRYRLYTMALANLKPSQLSMDFVDIHAASALLNQVYKLQQVHFNEIEISAFFEQENNYDRHALARVDIRQDPSLTATQKQQLLAYQISQLDEASQSAIQPSLDAQTIANALQNAPFEAAGDPEHSAKVALWSPDIQQRVQQFQQRNQQWQTKVNDYLAFSAVLTAKLETEPLSQQAHIRQQDNYLKQHFSSNEIKRIRVFIAHPELLNLP
ncbi:lipase secretion chaperone [Shewanella sp. SR44-3]|uniref:lipase secretion chaperone n=1 Tax=unclassified Shewanella TaxID=196818 RepID=UPI0015F85141|nr:lipase secretion chaperone [Shewanella sp. SR44-3]MBB1270827.1 hypothetical protein [Shewanella sp. SR44-3]